MAQTHLWRGEWIDDAELTRRLPTLADTLAEDCQQLPDLVALYRAGDALSAELEQHGSLYTLLHDEMIQSGDPAEEITANLATLTEFLRGETLKYQVLRAFGDPAPFTPRRIDYAHHHFEAWAPLGVLGHVTPANVRSVAAMSLMEGLLAGNINLLKTSRQDGLFTQKLLAALVAQEPSLKPFIYVLRLSSQDTEILQNLFALCDGVAVWGSEDAVASVRAITPPAARLIEWGHRISFAYLSRELRNDQATLQALALDVCQIEQQACSSPQCLYLETDDPAELHAFAEQFAVVLAEVSPTVPHGQPPGLHERAEITTTRELCRLAEAMDGSRVIEAPDQSWRLLVEPKPGLRASPLFRTLWIKPLPVHHIVATLRPLRTYLQTVGLACPLERLAELSRAFLAAGVTRIARPGEQLGGYLGTPHDGVYSLQRYTRRVALELPASTQGISSFAELEMPAPVTNMDAVPIMDKAAFLALPTDTPDAQLYFKSGGSSGEPKVSVFSHEDYRLQMQAAAEGLYAAGLEPYRDRCMNLFFAGHMYGSFISFWSILEHLQTVQFPMTGIDDYAEVAASIEQFRVDTLLGMPFYLVRLFHEQGERLQRYGGVRKIFYGGEHFPPMERARLQREFGVEIIRSAAYGSNDAGPMGYQCPHCEGGIHHLLTQTQSLEILAVDENRPVTADEVGRLVMTSQARQAQPIRRYETGDLGRWVNAPCPCGRQAPRFELMGRHGDLFRAPYFFSYALFARILAEQLGYAGEIQIVLNQGEQNRSRITLCLPDQTSLDVAKVHAALLEHYHDLREFVMEHRLTELAVEQLPLAQFVTTPVSGKLKHIVDLRQDNTQ